MVSLSSPHLPATARRSGPVSRTVARHHWNGISDGFNCRQPLGERVSFRALGFCGTAPSFKNKIHSYIFTNILLSLPSVLIPYSDLPPPWSPCCWWGSRRRRRRAEGSCFRHTDGRAERREREGSAPGARPALNPPGTADKLRNRSATRAASTSASETHSKYSGARFIKVLQRRS